MSHKYIALIPAYEPGTAFLELLEQLQRKDFEIVIVDDGSGPAFTSLFEKASAYGVVLSHTPNKGKGYALKTGFSYIKEHYENDCMVVTVDADGQHSAKDAYRLCQIADNHPDTLVLGSRKSRDNVPLRSRFGNAITRMVFRLSTGLSIYDTQTGLRACPAKLLPDLLSIPGERYEYEMNVLLEFAHKHVPILEQEIETIYLNHNEASHFHTLRDSYLIYKEILKFSASSLIGFLVDYCLYGILLLITTPLVPALALQISNICARIVSSSVNFTLNRKFVFKSSRSLAVSAFQYFLLAAVILFGNTLVLEALVTKLGLHQMLAKIVTELLFFILSWTVQRFIIFRRKNT